MSEIEPAAAFGMMVEPSFANPLKVFATMSQKAAMTSSVKSQQKSRKS